ncbi:MAG: hypothetical protein AAFR64_09115 [Pseudomonadota bacterium]
MEQAIKLLAGSLPLIFAFAFLVPVIDQGMAAIGLSAPFGLSTLTFALIVGGVWGLVAQATGRWL